MYLGITFTHDVHLISHKFYLSVCLHTDDLSKYKVATQSRTYPTDQRDPNKYIAGNAVDGDITTCMRTEPIGENSREKTVWWKVDLGGVYNIYSVSILFKNYDSYGMYKNMH